MSVNSSRALKALTEIKSKTEYFCKRYANGVILSAESADEEIRAFSSYAHDLIVTIRQYSDWALSN